MHVSRLFRLLTVTRPLIILDASVFAVAPGEKPKSTGFSDMLASLKKNIGSTLPEGKPAVKQAFMPAVSSNLRKSHSASSVTAVPSSADISRVAALESTDVAPVSEPVRPLQRSVSDIIRAKENANHPIDKKTASHEKDMSTQPLVKSLEASKSNPAPLDSQLSTSSLDFEAMQASLMHDYKLDIRKESSENDPSSFQYKVLENVVSDCMSNFREQIRNDIKNMHLELIRQFQIQKVKN